MASKKRLSRHKFENTRLQRLYQGIEMGMPYEHACIYAGISADTFENWRNGKFPRGITAEQRHDFFDNVEKAEGRALATKFGIILRSANGDTDRKIHPDWKAAAWLLEKRYPMVYGRTEVGMTHRGDEEAPVQIDMTIKEQELESVLERLSEDELAMLDTIIQKTTDGEE